jgi:hypothetical protein
MEHTPKVYFIFGTLTNPLMQGSSNKIHKEINKIIQYLQFTYIIKKDQNYSRYNKENRQLQINASKHTKNAFIYLREKKL